MALARAIDHAGAHRPSPRDAILPRAVLRRIRAVEIKARILADEALL